MKVETYEVERTLEDLDAIRDGEAQQLIEELGLTNQSRFYSEQSMEAMPYRKMTKDEGNVFKILCSQECSVENYSDGLIPLRVLQVYQHARSLDFFDSFVIWYPESADIKDPFLIGRKKVPSGSFHDTEQYILARWGEELWTFEKMKECAQEIYRGKLKAALAQIKRDVDSYYESVCADDDLDLSKGMPCWYR